MGDHERQGPAHGGADRAHDQGGRGVRGGGQARQGARRRAQRLRQLPPLDEGRGRGQRRQPGMGDKMDEDEKETVFDAIKDGQDWLSSNPEADAEETKEKQKEIEGICSPIIQKYYQGGAGGGGDDDDDDDDDEAHDEL